MAKKKPTRSFVSLSEGEKAYAMSRAVVQGDWCFVSGTVGYNYADGSLPEGAAQQAQNTFTNIMKALEAAGFELGHTIRVQYTVCLLYTSPSPRDRTRSRMPSSA